MLQSGFDLWPQVQRIDFRRHYEIIAVEPAYFVGPQSNLSRAPFSQYGGMMSFSLGQSADTKAAKAQMAIQFENRFILTD
jgi:hypothetical protein